MISFFTFITFLGSWKVITALTLATVVMMAIRRMHFRTITVFLIAVVTGEAIVLLLKNLLQFPRPETVNGAIMMAEGDYSFPSGHTFMAVVFYGFVIYLLSKYIVRKSLRWGLIVALVFLMLTIGYSRIYLGYHFASDVLWSLAFGALWLFLVIRWAMK